MVDTSIKAEGKLEFLVPRRRTIITQCFQHLNKLSQKNLRNMRKTVNLKLLLHPERTLDLEMRRALKFD